MTGPEGVTAFLRRLCYGTTITAALMLGALLVTALIIGGPNLALITIREVLRP